MTLNFQSLQRAAAQLEKSYGYLHSDMARDNAELRDEFRSATIQKFEYTYELAVKMIRRQLAEIVSDPMRLHSIVFNDLMREAEDAGIIADANAFSRYRAMRNETSHTYDETTAEKVAAEAGGFLSDMRFLLKQLERLNR